MAKISKMNNFILFLIVGAVNVLFADGCREEDCPNYITTSHYRDMKCKPIFGSDNCCPVAYDCPLLEKIRSNPHKCYIDDNEYNERDRIPSGKTGSICRAACFCSPSLNTPSRIQCAHIECPEQVFGYKPEPGCYFIYDLKKCCQKGQKCPDKDPSSIGKSCNVDGRSYRDGEKVYPETQVCSKCVCKDGELDCETINCGYELDAYRLAIQMSAVKYIGKGCCPIGTVDPTENDEIISKRTPSNLTCKYGKKILNIDDEVLMKEKCIKCTCKVPPLVTCMQDPNCH